MMFLIDFENIHKAGLEGIDSLTCKDTVVILFPNFLCNEVVSALTNCQTEATVQLHCISTGYKDALDLKLITKALLAYKLGEKSLVFVSKDTIYNVLHDALSEFGYLGIIRIGFAYDCKTIHTIWDFSCGQLKVLTSLAGQAYELIDGRLVELPGEHLVCRKQEAVNSFASIKLKGINLNNLAELHQYASQLETMLPSDSLKNKLYHDTECISLPTETVEQIAETSLAVQPAVDRVLTALNWEKAIEKYKCNFIPTHKSLFKQATKSNINCLVKVLILKPATDRSLYTIVHLSSSYLGCSEKQLEKLLKPFWEKII